MVRAIRTHTHYLRNSMILRSSILLISALAVLLSVATAPRNHEVDESTSAVDCSEEAKPVSIVYVEIEPRSFGVNEPQSMYDKLTGEEINLIEVVIQHEVGGLSAEYKKLITELIYNRIISSEFPDSVREVLYQRNQFCGIESWYYPDYPVDEETKQIVKEVFSSPETSHQATYYYNPALSEYESLVWFEYSGDVMYEFEYEETSWGVTYTTRFFR